MASSASASAMVDGVQHHFSGATSDHHSFERATGAPSSLQGEVQARAMLAEGHAVASLCAMTTDHSHKRRTVQDG
eukprot:m.101269 g.101269  ORF g.101269 m.101269 type:complete len:75 (+) comp12505_c0_seq6:2204-2428(+)